MDFEQLGRPFLLWIHDSAYHLGGLTAQVRRTYASGYRVFANQLIQRGSPIFFERPGNPEQATFERKQQRISFELARTGLQHGCNVETCGEPESVDSMAIYPTISQIKHSCLPNACFFHDSITDCGVIHALRDIKPGEEICVERFLCPEAEHRKVNAFRLTGEDCLCKICAPSYSTITASNQRRRQIKDIESSITDPYREGSPGKLADCLLLIRLLEIEYSTDLHPTFVVAYETAMDFHMRCHDYARALVCTRAAYLVALICYSRDLPRCNRLRERIEDLDGIVARSSGIINGIRVLSQIPSHLNKLEYTNWLWKGASPSDKIEAMNQLPSTHV